MSLMSCIWSSLNSAREWLCQILSCDSPVGKSVKIRGDKNDQIVDSHDNTANDGGTVNITYNNTTNHHYYQNSSGFTEGNPITDLIPAPHQKEALKEPVKEAGEKKLNRTDEFKQSAALTDAAKTSSESFKKMQKNVSETVE